ncbi:MAG: hypothetical protein NDJ89_16860 [Oligoflexia bacterium]|nr:hypothetical protein [Oligoflexia bacterium]
MTEPDEFKMTEEKERAWIQRLNEAPQDLAIVAEINGAIVRMLSFQCRKQRRLLIRDLLAWAP